MGTEYLDQRDLQGGDLAMHEDARQIQLHLETNIDLGIETQNRNGDMPELYS